jgi:hypothetical protein
MTDQAQSKESGFELDDIINGDNENTFDVSVKEDIDGNTLSGFKIVGKDSQEYRLITSYIRRENIKRSAKRQQAIDTKTDVGAEQLGSILDENDFAIAEAVTVGWYGFNVEGAPASFDKSKLPSIFSKKPTWQAKILAELNKDANFTKS